MQRTLTASLLALALTGCGGGSSDNDHTETRYSISNSAQSQAEKFVDGLADDLEANQTGLASSDLTGVWVEVWGDVYDFSQSLGGQTGNGKSKDTGFDVYRMVDNGTTVVVTECADATEQFEFALNAQGNIADYFGTSEFNGVVKSHKRIDFGVTPYQGSYSDGGVSGTYEGDYTSRWVKISNNPDATIGTANVAGFGTAAIQCAALYESDWSFEGDEFSEFGFGVLDEFGNVFASDSDTLNSTKPVRDGDTYTATVDGWNVTFTFD